MALGKCQLTGYFIRFKFILWVIWHIKSKRVCCLVSQQAVCIPPKILSEGRTSFHRFLQPKASKPLGGSFIPSAIRLYNTRAPRISSRQRLLSRLLEPLISLCFPAYFLHNVYTLICSLTTSMTIHLHSLHCNLHNTCTCCYHILFCIHIAHYLYCTLFSYFSSSTVAVASNEFPPLGRWIKVYLIYNASGFKTLILLVKCAIISFKKVSLLIPQQGNL